jgi:hypothetical protein
VSHELAAAFQETIAIGDLRSEEEADVDVALEGVDVRECRISHAGGGVPVVEQLADVVAAAADDVEPAAGDRA